MHYFLDTPAPLAEKYNYQSPYDYAENKVVDHIELEGLEGLHHTFIDKAGNKSHLIQKNVVFLRQNPQLRKEFYLRYLFY